MHLYMKQIDAQCYSRRYKYWLTQHSTNIAAGLHLIILCIYIKYKSITPQTILNVNPPPCTINYVLPMPFWGLSSLSVQPHSVLGQTTRSHLLKTTQIL